MTFKATFTVTDWWAPAREADAAVRGIAERCAGLAAANTPVDSGTLKGGWRVVPSGRPGVYAVVNWVRYGPFVEYGTKHMAAHAMLGRAVAAIRGGAA